MQDFNWTVRTCRSLSHSSMAGFSILADAVVNDRFPVLLHDMLGPLARSDVIVAYRLGVLFVVFHELGHIELGHLTASRGRSERQPFALAEPELLSGPQQDEIEADAFALDHIASHCKQEIMPSLVFFFTPFTSLETFSGGLSANHPLAVNRLSALAERANMPPEVKPVIAHWIEGQLAAFRRTLESRKQVGGDLRAKIGRRCLSVVRMKFCALSKSAWLARRACSTDQSSRHSARTALRAIAPGIVA